MTFVLDTESKSFDQQQTKFHQQHQVVIKAPIILEFVNTYLLKGNLAWIEGKLDPGWRPAGAE